MNMRVVYKSGTVKGLDEYLSDERYTDEFGQRFLVLLGAYLVRSYLDNGQLPDGIDRIAGDRVDLWALLSVECESPIEKILLSHLLFAKDGYEFFNTASYPYDDTYIVTTIDPQAKIGAYRVDFLIEVRVRHKIGRVVIECDGHAFHEKTKEQAARDKARDRAITQSGAKLLRFSGSEIVGNGPRCAAEIAELVQSVRSDCEDQVPGWMDPL